MKEKEDKTGTVAVASGNPTTENVPSEVSVVSPTSAHPFVTPAPKPEERKPGGGFVKKFSGI